jgi:hypothetical protein
VESAAPTPVNDSRAILRSLFVRALVIRVLLAMALHFMVEERTFAPDQETYHSVASSLIQLWSGQTFITPGPLTQSGPKGYFYIVAGIYYLLGSWSLLPKLLNALLGALTVLITHDLARRITGNDSVALRTAKYVAFFPSLVLWSALNIRDVWVLFLILLVCREGLILHEKFKIVALGLLVSSIFLLVQFREYILFPVTLPLIVSFFLRRGGATHLVRNAIVGMVAAIVVIYADQAAGQRRLRNFDLVELNETRYWNTVGASSAFEQVDISTTEGLVTFLPKGLALFMLAPFPWMLGSIRQALAVPETLFFYSLLPPMLRGIGILLRRHLGASLMVVLLTGAMTFGYALGEGNAGTAYRHRAQMLPFYLMFAAVGIELRTKKREFTYEPAVFARPA